MEYILKMKTISNNLTVAGKRDSDLDHVLQLLVGLRSEYNIVVASLTTKEDELLLYSVHSILLIYE